DGRFAGLEQVVDEQPLGHPGVEEAVEGDDHRAGLEHGGVGVDFVAVAAIGPVGSSSSVVHTSSQRLLGTRHSPQFVGTAAIAVRTRLAETEYAVPRDWAKSETRSSSIIHPMATTSSARRRSGGSASRRSA